MDGTANVNKVGMPLYFFNECGHGRTVFHTAKPRKNLDGTL